jgi:hypothetical protein
VLETISFVVGVQCFTTRFRTPFHELVEQNSAASRLFQKVNGKKEGKKTSLTAKTLPLKHNETRAHHDAKQGLR